MSTGSYTRRDFIKALGLGAASLALPGCASAFRSGASEVKRPNVVLIMSDDMGYSDIGCYGGEINTPNLDKLAAGGLRFTQFYNTARCCPTRAALLTGLYQHQAGIGHMMNDKGYGGYRGDLNNHCVTIAEVLKQSGYSAYMVGKWHVTRHDGKDGPKHNWPLQRGFDKFYGTITGAGSFYDPTTLCRNNTFITPENDPEYKPQSFYYTNAISDNAIKYIKDHYRQSPKKPFFIYVAYTAAHWPMHALEKDIAKYKGKYDKGYGYYRRKRHERLKEMGLINKSWQLSEQAGDPEVLRGFEHKEWEARCMEVYAAMVDNMDHNIGRIIVELKNQGVFENTLIMFLQDNGGCAEGMGRGANVNEKWVGAIKDRKPMGPDELQPNISPPMKTRDGRAVRGGPSVMPGPEDTYIAYGRNWANVSNTPFREYKHWVHEGGIATPLIVHWPARIRTYGELRYQPGHLIDIMATFVDVAGTKYPNEYKGYKITPLEGKSLVPAFDNKPIEREALYWEHEGNRAVRKGKWKLVSKYPGGWELYDIEADRTELNNLAEEHPEIVKELAGMYDVWAKRSLVVPWSELQKNERK